MKIVVKEWIGSDYRKVTAVSGKNARQLKEALAVLREYEQTEREPETVSGSLISWTPGGVYINDSPVQE